MAMRKLVCLVGSMASVTACTQLPARNDIALNQVPVFQAGTIIDSNNGLLSDGISKVPGTICIAGDDGKCDPKHLTPRQCLINGATVEVKPTINPTPAYHSLIDNKYTGTTSVPFVSPSVNGEELEEIKATVAGTAQISNATQNSGYPGISGIKACLLDIYGPGNYQKIYWIQAANIIAVTKSRFRQVSSALDVSATGFGMHGTTYNHDGFDEEKVWIGLQAAEIPVGVIAAAEKLPATVVATPAPDTIIVQPHAVPEMAPKATTETILPIVPQE